MYGAGVNVFAVWGYVIAKARSGMVELNPKRLADTLGGKVEEIEGAIEFLCRKDPHSRFKEHDGRRLLKEGEFQYFVPSHEYYRKIQNEEHRREYNRGKQAEYREKKKLKLNGLPVSEPLTGEGVAVRAMEAGNEGLADSLAAERKATNDTQ